MFPLSTKEPTQDTPCKMYVRPFGSFKVTPSTGTIVPTNMVGHFTATVTARRARVEDYLARWWDRKDWTWEGVDAERAQRYATRPHCRTCTCHAGKT